MKGYNPIRTALTLAQAEEALRQAEQVYAGWDFIENHFTGYRYISGTSQYLRVYTDPDGTEHISIERMGNECGVYVVIITIQKGKSKGVKHCYIGSTVRTPYTLTVGQYKDGTDNIRWIKQGNEQRQKEHKTDKKSALYTYYKLAERGVCSITVYPVHLTADVKTARTIEKLLQRDYEPDLNQTEVNINTKQGETPEDYIIVHLNEPGLYGYEQTVLRSKFKCTQVSFSERTAKALRDKIINNPDYAEEVREELEASLQGISPVSEDTLLDIEAREKANNEPEQTNEVSILTTSATNTSNDYEGITDAKADYLNALNLLKKRMERRADLYPLLTLYYESPDENRTDFYYTDADGARLTLEYDPENDITKIAWNTQGLYFDEDGDPTGDYLAEEDRNIIAKVLPGIVPVYRAVIEV